MLLTFVSIQTLCYVRIPLVIVCNTAAFIDASVVPHTVNECLKLTSYDVFQPRRTMQSDSFPVISGRNPFSDILIQINQCNCTVYCNSKTVT